MNEFACVLAVVAMVVMLVGCGRVAVVARVVGVAAGAWLIVSVFVFR